MSLSRKYRPHIFGDVTGQRHITETLRREVATGKIGHAYLFFGPRGVGKTTTARIFAKALNCTDPQDGEPCNVCARCGDANTGRAVDVIEMDAASHTGVDNIREGIVDHVRFAPSASAYKIYILDEAHMLSASAWNAMLKTLEEPPPHGIFILATTEFHKVPATIVSRCQRFEFTRISRADIEARARTLAAREHRTISDEVVTRIAKHADGSVRDAETLLGQLLALGEQEIGDDAAGLVLPVSRVSVAAEFLETAGTRSLKATMDMVSVLDAQGIHIIPFFHDIIEAVRHLLIASDDPAYLEDLRTGDEGERAVAKIAGRFSAAELRDIALHGMERRKDAKQGIDPRFALELFGAGIALGILPNSPDPRPERHASQTPSAPSQINPEHERRVSKHPDDGPQEPELVESADAVETRSEDDATDASRSGRTIALADLQNVWHSFLKRVSEEHPSLSFILKTGTPHDVRDGTVVIRVSYPFHRTKLVENLSVKQKLEDILRDVLDARVTLDAVTEQEPTEPGRADFAPAADTVGKLIENFGGHVEG